MLLVSRNLVFIENESVLLCATLWKRARAFAATIWCITFWHSFCHYKGQFLWCTFQTHFDMGTRHYWKVVFRMKLFLSLESFIYHIANTRVWKCFHLCRYQSQKFSVALHSCRSCIAIVSLVLHSCRSCLALVLYLN